MQNIVTPRIMSGFMELLPKDQVVFNKMKQTIQTIFDLNGFLPIDTPVLELSEILLAKAGGETEKQIYRFTKGDTDISMRFDLTVPLARYVAQHQSDLVFPFKRSHIAKSYRGERSQKGRFREFYQCDADIIGDGELSIVADAECISLIYQVYSALKIDDILIRISNRKVLNGLMEMLGISNSAQVLHILDKFGKMPNEEIEDLLCEMSVTKEQSKTIMQILTTKLSNSEMIEYLKNIENQNETYSQGVSELEQVFTLLKSMKVPEKYVALDTTVIRGLDYYTGTIFETTLLSHKEFGSVGGGGRYENLAGNYTKSKLPGVGVSFGLTRLFDCLMKNDMLGNLKQVMPKVMIIPLGQTLETCLGLSKQLINEGISTSVLYENKSFKNKLNQANRQSVPFVIIVGEDEVKNNNYCLKNMESGEQQTLDLENLLRNLRG